mgnify:FL=1
MRAALPEAALGFLPPRVRLNAVLGNGGTPKLRRGEPVEVAAHCAMAHRSSEIVSTSDGCRGRAPRIEAARCNELSGLDVPPSYSSCSITIAISGRALTFTARRERRMACRALGAPRMLFYGPLHRIVIRHDHDDSEADPVPFR